MSSEVFDRTGRIIRLRQVVARREKRLAELKDYLALLEGANMNAAHQGVNLTARPTPKKNPARKPEESKK